MAKAKLEKEEGVLINATDVFKADHKQYLEGVQTPVMAVDPEMNVIYMNPYGAKLLGSTPEKVLGKKCYDLFQTDDCNTAKCACAAAIKTKKPATSETISRAGGGELHISYTGSPLYNKSGEVIGAVEYVANITELKKEMAKSAQRNQYLEGVQTPVMAVDPEMSVLYMNEYGAKLLGSTPEKVLGKKCYDLFQTDDCNTAKCACAACMKVKKPVTSETISRAGGGEMHINYTGSPLYDQSGEVIGAVEYVANITELKKTMNTIASVVETATGVSEEIDGFAGQVLKAAENVGAMGTQAAQAADKLKSSMQQVQSAAQNVSEGSQNLSKLSQDVAKNLEELMKKMNEVDTNTTEVNTVVTESSRLSDQVSSSGKEALTALDEIKKSATSVEDTIGEVNTAVKNVAGLADDISQIAGQVNMLALNAAIEAARAGEAGRGFAVVADAVKQLAGQAGNAAKTAIESIEGITKSGNNAAEMSKSSGQVAMKGDKTVSEAVNGSQQVAASMEKVLGITKNLTETVHESSQHLEQVNSAIQQVASFSEESASAAEESAASIEEQTAATEQVASAAKKLQEEGQHSIEIAQKIAAEVKKLRAELAKAKTVQTNAQEKSA